MPEMMFHVRWPDGSTQACYSPSQVVTQHLEAGRSYPLPEFVERSRTALNLASDLVQQKHGYPCINARGQLAVIEATAARLDPTGDVLVERFQP